MGASIRLRLGILFVFLFAKKFPDTLGFSTDCELNNKQNLTNVDVVIYIGARIPSYTTDIPPPIREDLLEAHWIHPQFDNRHNVYTPRYTPKKIKRIIYASLKGLAPDVDDSLRVYDSATEAGVLAHLGSFNKNNENILLMIGPEIFNERILWKSRKMIYLNTILGTLYPLYESQTSKQRYKQMYIYNATKDVLLLAESIESGRRIVRYISNINMENRSVENVAKLMGKFFNPKIITQEILHYPQRNKSEAQEIKKIVHLKYTQPSVDKSVYLISTNSTQRGISTIAGFFKILQNIQPTRIEYRAAVICAENENELLSGNYTDMLHKIFGSESVKGKHRIYYISGGNVVSSRKDLQYHGENGDSEFGPHTFKEDLEMFTGNLAVNGSPVDINFTMPFTSPLTPLISRILLSHV